MEAVAQTESFFRSHNLREDINEYLESYRALVSINLYNIIVRSDYTGIERKILKGEILGKRRQYFHNQVLNKKTKIMIFIMDKLPRLYDCAIKCITGRRRE